MIPKIKRFLPAFYILAVLALAAGFLLSLPKALSLVESKASAASIPSNKVLFPAQAQAEVAGAQKSYPPPKDLGNPPPILSAAGVLVEDLDSGFLFYAKDPNKRVPIASTTKIMTALVSADHFKANDVLTVGSGSMVEGSSMGLKAGEQLTFRSLLYGMLLNSGNDAAYTIAANYPGGVPGFVGVMNQKAKNLGLNNTNFENPAGFDNPNHYSSASDLAKIAALVEGNYQLARVVATKDTTVASLDKTLIHPLKNLNKLLSLPGVLGVKTGFTPKARENLVGLVERDGHKVLTVVLGSEDRFGETEQLINWVFANFLWQ